jgi:hypothetical protein
MTQLLFWAQNNQVLSAGTFLAGIILLRELTLERLASNQITYQIILFPGVILHELSHLIGCFITFTKVKQVKFFSQKGGFVIHEKSSFYFLGNFIISIAPLIIGLFLSYQIIHLIYSPQGLRLRISSIIYLYFLVSIITTMLPSKTDILNSLPAYLASLSILVIFNDRIKIPYFTQVFVLLLTILAILAVSYIIMLIFGQKRFFKLR